MEFKDLKLIQQFYIVSKIMNTAPDEDIPESKAISTTVNGKTITVDKSEGLAIDEINIFNNVLDDFGNELIPDKQVMGVNIATESDSGSCVVNIQLHSTEDNKKSVIDSYGLFSEIIVNGNIDEVTLELANFTKSFSAINPEYLKIHDYIMEIHEVAKQASFIPSDFIDKLYMNPTVIEMINNFAKTVKRVYLANKSDNDDYTIGGGDKILFISPKKNKLFDVFHDFGVNYGYPIPTEIRFRTVVNVEGESNLKRFFYIIEVDDTDTYATLLKKQINGLKHIIDKHKIDESIHDAASSHLEFLKTLTPEDFTVVPEPVATQLEI